MDLEPGTYNIFHVRFVSPDAPVVKRAVGIDNGALVILPEGAEAPKWMVESQPGGFKQWMLFLGNSSIAPEGHQVRETPPGFPPHAWFILRGAPTPPPVGNNTFAIYTEPANPGANAWNPASEEPSPEPTLVELSPIGYPWWFVRVDE